MSKIAAYLQEHISGEVSTNSAVLTAMSHDASVLEIKPEMVVYPRVTSDIRKVARFAWQLAEKGHVLPLTVRGGGTDQTGGAIGKGVILATTAHMNQLFELDVKQKLLRLQPGATFKAINDALNLHGLTIPSAPVSAAYSTIGGAIGNNTTGPLSGKYGDTAAWIQQLEVVLANGEVLQTERLSKRELNRRKGLQTFEGEIYRSLDSLIEDNRQLIEETLSSGAYSNMGYAALAKVKQRDGSFDLAPLIAGSQGTLGIVSEMIMKATFFNPNSAAAVLVFPNSDAARDALDALKRLEPSILEYYDGEIFAAAAAQGKKYALYEQANVPVSAVIIVAFDEFSERARQRKLKKLRKMFDNTDIAVQMADGEEAREILAIRDVTSYVCIPAGSGMSAPPLFDGAYVPSERLDDFRRGVEELATNHHVTLPLHIRALEELVYTRPALHLRKVGDKQKILKLLDEFALLVQRCDGCLIGDGSEGRLKARFAYRQLDDELKALFKAVKDIFDPYGILNPGVKQEGDLRQLASHLRADYDTAAFAAYVPRN